MITTNRLLTVFFLFALTQSFAQASFSLPGDGNWYRVASMGGMHGYLEYTYWHATPYNPSISKGEIEFINSKNQAMQHHQTMGYSAWNQLQFAILNQGSNEELWVKATPGISTGTFTIERYQNCTIDGVTGDSDLSNNGGTLTVYDKLGDNSHTFAHDVDIKRGSLTVENSVSIGTINPGSFKLAVEGKVGAREVNVTATMPWPDYVFEKDYALPSLDSIKTYIDQHKHLPEVPSAKEMEANGVNLGEMNMVLLKKMEEMTLYMIELKNENEMLKLKNTEIDKLKSEVEMIKNKLR